MYNIVPVATAESNIITGESELEILLSVIITIMIPIGDMSENKVI